MFIQARSGLHCTPSVPRRDTVAYHKGIIVGFPKLYSLISGFSQISTQDSSKYKIQLREILKTYT